MWSCVCLFCSRLLTVFMGFTAVLLMETPCCWQLDPTWGSGLNKTQSPKSSCSADLHKYLITFLPEWNNQQMNWHSAVFSSGSFFLFKNLIMWNKTICSVLQSSAWCLNFLSVKKLSNNSGMCLSCRCFVAAVKFRRNSHSQQQQMLTQRQQQQRLHHNSRDIITSSWALWWFSGSGTWRIRRDRTSWPEEPTTRCTAHLSSTAGRSLKELK